MRIAQVLILLIVVFLSAGCATSSMFVPYPVQMESTKLNIATSQFQVAQDELGKKRRSTDAMLYLMERGRVSFLAKDYASSIKDFAQVIQALERHEEKAKITLTGTMGQGASLLTNDNAIPYVGAGYERVFVHHYQALNYLFTGDLEAAGVEVRRANLEQQLALKRHEEELDKAMEGRQAKRIQAGDVSASDKLASLSALAGSVKNSFQNAYTFYVSGLIYEAMGEYNNALIDYKKALEIFPDNEFVIADVVRLANKLGFDEDSERLGGKVRKHLQRTPNTDEGKVVIIYEYGYVPKKHEIGIPFGTHQQMQLITLPTYIDLPISSPPLKLDVPNAKTQPIINVSALAAKALQEKMPMAVVRQVSRIFLRETHARSNDNLLSAVASLGHLVLNTADRRSWLTLPATVQIAHAFVEQGERTFNLNIGSKQLVLPVSVKAGKTTLIYVNYADGQIHSNTVRI